MNFRKSLLRILFLLMAAYCAGTLPLASLVCLSDHYRAETMLEFTRKLAHLRSLKYAKVGDSLVAQEADWGSLLGGSRFSAINLGTPGHTISQIQAQLDNAAHLKPRYVSIMAGTNDYSQGRTDEQILADFERLLQHAHELGLHTVLVTSIPLRADTIHDPHLTVLNRRLQEVVEANGSTFLNLNSAILNTANRAALFQSDGLHFAGGMYDLWARLLREHTKS